MHEFDMSLVCFSLTAWLNPCINHNVMFLNFVLRVEERFKIADEEA